MEKRISSRAIIIDDDSVLAIFRRKRKDGVVKEYYVIPGGGLEDGETLEENVIRELKEEISVDIEILGYLGIVEREDTIGHYFHCKITNGTPVLGGEEKDRMSEDNYYEIKWLKLNEIEKYDLSAIDKIKMAINHEYIER